MTNVFISKLNFHYDNRGSFVELYKSNDAKQISIAESKSNVLRGMHCSPYNKIVKCLKGKIFDVVVDLRFDSETYLQQFHTILEEGDEQLLHIPAGYAHGYYSYTESVIEDIQTGIYIKKYETEFNCFDPELKIPWPQSHEYIMSEKDKTNPVLKDISTRRRVDFLIYGSSGFFGSVIVDILEKEEDVYYECVSTRITDLKSIEHDLERFKPKYVICAAGLSGRPNIDWCENNKDETIMTNVVGQLNVVSACHKRNILCVVFGTGALYNSTTDKKSFTENCVPNYDGNFYVRQRIILEQLLKGYNNVLNLRVLYPIQKDIKTMHERSFLSKLFKFEKISNVPSSYTIVDDLFPLIPKMCQMSITGTYNFVNPGTATNGDIMNAYGKNWVLSDEQFTRSHCELDVSKLLCLFPNVPNVKTSIYNSFSHSISTSQT